MLLGIKCVFQNINIYNFLALNLTNASNFNTIEVVGGCSDIHLQMGDNLIFKA